MSTKDESPWKPIETAPTDGTAILCFDPTGYHIQVYVVCWDHYLAEHGDDSGWVEASGEYCHTWNPTHWMPLPLPPAPQIKD